MAVFSLIPTNVTMYNHDYDLPFIRGVTMVSQIGMQPWAIQTKLCTAKPPQMFLKYRFLRPHEIRISGVGIQIYSPHVGVCVGHCIKSFLIQLIILEVSTEYLAQITPPCELSPVKSFTVSLWATECSFCYFFHFSFLFLFCDGFHHTVYTGMNLSILLPQHPKYQDYKYVPPQPDHRTSL